MLRSYRGGYRRSTLSYLCLGIGLSVLLLPNVTGAISPSIYRFTPPYGSGSSYQGSWTNGTNSGNTCRNSHSASNSSSVDLSSGEITLSLNASARRCGQVAVTELAGFQLPFRVTAATTFTVTATWALKWNGTRSDRSSCLSYPMLVICKYAEAPVNVTLELSVIDASTGIAMSPVEHYELVSPWPSWFPGTHYYAGSLQKSLRSTVSLSPHHFYEVKTWIRADIQAQGRCAHLPGHSCNSHPRRIVSSSSSFDMLSPSYGAWLDRVTIH
jgi:hypothetical protein